MSTRATVIPGAEAWSSPGEGTAAEVGVLVVHGFSGNPVSTRPLGEAVAAAGYAVEVLRLPGHGTHWRDLARTTYADWRGAVGRALARMLEDHRAVVLVGFSMGGTLVLDLAAERCRYGRAGGLAGVATINGLVVSPPNPLKPLSPVLQHLLPYIPPKAAGITPDDIAKGGSEQAYPWISHKAVWSYARELPRVLEGLPEVTLPVLVAQSRDDHTVHPSNADAIAAGVATEDVTQLWLERSCHVATLDHDAEHLFEQVNAFVGRTTG
ncbi:MAG: alpha/beta hydrolase [Nitriliruptorales bacterium]